MTLAMCFNCPMKGRMFSRLECGMDFHIFSILLGICFLHRISPESPTRGWVVLGRKENQCAQV
jgi:hypothetical protein